MSAVFFGTNVVVKPPEAPEAPDTWRRAAWRLLFAVGQESAGSSGEDGGLAFILGVW